MSQSTVDLVSDEQVFVLAYAEGFTSLVTRTGLKKVFQDLHYQGEPLPDIYVNDRGYLVRTKVSSSLGEFNEDDLAVLEVIIEVFSEKTNVWATVDGRV